MFVKKFLFAIYFLVKAIVAFCLLVLAFLVAAQIVILPLSILMYFTTPSCIPPDQLEDFGFLDCWMTANGCIAFLNSWRIFPLMQDLYKRFLKELDETFPRPEENVENEKMVEIPTGSFVMGALEEDAEAMNAEKPSRKVQLARPFLMGTRPVTQSLWFRIMRSNPSMIQGKRRPVESVSWLNCVEFCNKLSEEKGLDKAYTINAQEISCDFDVNGYRLPTEAEWEYAAKANQGFEYSGSDNIDEVAWYNKNSNKMTHPVGQKKPNGFGLYDMTGNMWEWCWDFWNDETDDYSNASCEDPTGPKTGTSRVRRGGSWHDDTDSLRVNHRRWSDPSYKARNLGLRLCKTIGSIKESAGE